LTVAFYKHPQCPLKGATARAALACALSLAAIAAPGASLAAEAGPPVTTYGEDVVAKARQKLKELEAVEAAEMQARSGAAQTSPQVAVPSDTFYGPPVPKARKGEIGNIDWTAPEAFVPPALEEAVNTVTEKYPSLLAARAALKAAASDVKTAKWQRFPTINGELAYIDDNASPEPELIIEAPVWTGGRLSANIRRAKAREDATSAQYIETMLDLALTTAQAYFEIARLTQREQLLESSLKEHEALVATMERRVAQEVSPIADLELAKSRAAQIEQDYTTTSAQRRSTLRVLAELIADPTYDLGPIPQYDPAQNLRNREAFEDQAVAYSPTLGRLRSETDIARAELDTRRASIFPQLNAQYTYNDVFGSRVGVVVRAQNTGLAQFTDVESARLRIQSSLEAARVVEQQLRRDIETALIQYDAAKRRSEISLSAAATAARVSASYTRQFIAGRRSWLDVMNALREAVTAEIGRSDAEVTVMATAAQLLLRSGRWRPVFSDSDANGYEVGQDSVE
jgi:adhesin transport system outer membrane protein